MNQILYSPRATNPTTVTSSGAVDAGKVPLLGNAGLLDRSMIPVSGSVLRQDFGEISTDPGISWTEGNFISLTLSSSVALNLPDMTLGNVDRVIIEVFQGTAGNHVITWLGNIDWETDLPPTLSITPGFKDYLEFLWTGSSFRLVNFVSGLGISISRSKVFRVGSEAEQVLLLPSIGDHLLRTDLSTSYVRGQGPVLATYSANISSWGHGMSPGRNAFRLTPTSSFSLGASTDTLCQRPDSTLECWVYVNGTQSAILSFADKNTSQILFYTGSAIVFQLNQWNGFHWSAPVSPGWHHVAIVRGPDYISTYFNSDSYVYTPITLYVDGIAHGIEKWQYGWVGYASGPLTFGYPGYNPSGQYFINTDILIQDVRIYQEMLPASVVADHAAGINYDRPSLATHIRCDEGSGSTLSSFVDTWYLLSSGKVDWSSVEGTPTTLSGYGITDSLVTPNQLATTGGSDSAGKIPVLSSQGKLPDSMLSGLVSSVNGLTGAVQIDLEDITSLAYVGGSADAGKVPVLNSQGQLPTAMVAGGSGGGGTTPATTTQSLGNVLGSVNPDWSLGKSITLTLVGTSVLTLPNVSTTYDKVYLWIYQDSTGSRFFTWGGNNIKWPGGLIPDQSISANSMDFYEFTWNGSFFLLTNFIQDGRA